MELEDDFYEKFDEEGNPVYLDSEGCEVEVDDNGNQVRYDKVGDRVEEASEDEADWDLEEGTGDAAMNVDKKTNVKRGFKKPR